MKEILEKHERIALHFSGGKDSLACLLLLKDWWEKINVIWCNTGDAFPETINIVQKYASALPHFIEVKSDVKGFIKKFGMPSDIVPIMNTSFGIAMTAPKAIKISNAFDCTAQNMWFPVMKATSDIGATLVVRGQRNDESMKSSARSGYIENGIEYLFPIENWTKDQVLEYLESEGVEIPEHFQFEESSLDCMGCTAFCQSHIDRLEYMKRRHPQKYEEVKKNVASILEVIKSQSKFMELV